MIEKSIVFGRTVSGENTVALQEPDISARHAKITFLGNDQFEVEDLGSTNGTYVNGYRVQKTTVNINDQVRLSSGTILDLVKIFGLKPSQTPNQELSKNNPKDFTVEFARLKPIYENYKRDRKKMILQHNQKTALIRTGITVLPLPVLFFFPGKPIYSALSLMGAGVANFVTGNMYNTDKLEELDEKFRLQYVCPNRECSMQLGTSNSWNLHFETGKCFRCGAIYNANKL